MSSRNILPMNKVIQSLTETEEKNNINNIKKQIHPLDFYTLGKVDNPPKYISNYNPNKGFRSTSNDLINRNLFSLNSSKYDNLIKNKNFSVLSEQNINENNYLNPLEVFKAYKKPSLPSNAINIETYNIAKEKIFTKSSISLIKKGLQLTHTNFINCKNKLLTENSSRNINKTTIDKINNKNLVRMKTETKINNKSNEIKSKYGFDNENNNDKNNYDNQYNSISKPTIKYINPIDYSKKQLKANTLYFDKNNQQFLRHKNWWKVEK